MEEREKGDEGIPNACKRLSNARKNGEKSVLLPIEWERLVER